MVKIKFFRLALALLASFSAAIAGGFYTSQGLPEWYGGLSKPTFTPPAWVFGPAWTVLYLLIGVALYRAWKRTKKGKIKEIWGLFSIHWLLNVSWSYLFFAAKAPELALIEIVVLWLAIGVMMRRFYQADRIAGLLLLPYLIWVGFATALNYAIVALN